VTNPRVAAETRAGIPRFFAWIPRMLRTASRSSGTVSAIGSEGGFTTYTVTLAPHDLFPQLAVQSGQTTMLTDPNTVVVYADSNTQMLNSNCRLCRQEAIILESRTKPFGFRSRAELRMGASKPSGLGVVSISRASAARRQFGASCRIQCLQDQAAQTAMRAERDRGLAFTTISTSCPRATKKRISRSTEKPSSL